MANPSIAVCLHGRCGGSGKYGIDEKNYQSEILKIGAVGWNKFIKTYNADLYYHTWSTECTNQLHDVFTPKSCLIEPCPKHIDLIEDKQTRSLFSRWLSVKRVIELVKNYDLILLSRFDLLYNLYIDYSNLESNCLYLPYWIKRFDVNTGENIKAESFYSLPVDQINNPEKMYVIMNGFPFAPDSSSVMDIYMFGSEDIVRRVSYIYDNIGEYIKPGHVYEVEHPEFNDTHRILTYHLFQHQIPFQFVGDDLLDAPLIRRLLPSYNDTGSAAHKILRETNVL